MKKKKMNILKLKIFMSAIIITCMNNYNVVVVVVTIIIKETQNPKIGLVPFRDDIRFIYACHCLVIDKPP